MIEEDDLKWIRTEISRGAELIDGQAWMAAFQEQLKTAMSSTGAGASGQNSRQPPGCSDMALRNKVLREFVKTCPPGRKVQLSTGQTVIFWFNVGAPGPPRRRVYVTDAVCPHQGVCLLGAELFEIEDLAGVRRASTRCPRHNKAFDICSGSSAGNVETLKTYPCRFEHGRWYVGIACSFDDHVAAADNQAASGYPALMPTLGSTSFVDPVAFPCAPSTPHTAPCANAVQGEHDSVSKTAKPQKPAVRKKQRIGYEFDG